MLTSNSENLQGNIRKAFLTLSLSKPVESITITEIAKQAFIDRTTFYHYYQDIFQLLNECVIEGTALNLRTDLPMENILADMKNSIASALNFYAQYPNIALTVLNKFETSPYLKGYLDVTLQYQFFLQDLLISDQSRYYVDKEFLGNFCVIGSAHMIKRWLDNGKIESDQEMANSIVRFFVLTICANAGSEIPAQLKYLIKFEKI